MSAWRTLDRVSLLVELEAEALLATCEADLQREGLTLSLSSPALAAGLTVGVWLARGAPGAPDPWTDPADHLVAGLTATLRDGRMLAIHPAPRRAVGPDLIALIVGMENRYARVERAWLRVHRLDAPRPEMHILVADRNPPISGDEATLLAAIAGALSDGGG